MDAASYSIDETAALNFLSGLGFREGTGGQLKCRKAVDEEDIVLEGDIRIGIRAEEQRYSKEGLIMDEHIIIDQKPTTPQYVDSQHSRWSAFSNLTHLGFFHKRRNEPSRLFTGSASTLRDDALMPSPSSAKRMLDPSRLWTRQAKRSAQDRKAGISFADLLVPSISPLFPPTPHNDGEPRGSVRRNIEVMQKNKHLSISMEPMTGNKKNRQHINDKFKRVCYPFEENNQVWVFGAGKSLGSLNDYLV